MKRKILKKLNPYCLEIVQLKQESHLMCKLKNGELVTISISKGDERNVWNNIRRNFRKCGIELPLK